MAIRNIRTDEDPILRKKSRVITSFDDKLAELVEDMIDTMDANDGIGIAAVQVGALRRVVIVMDPEFEKPVPNVLVNPEIIWYSGVQCKLEGCLSVPDRSGTVERPTNVRVKYQDINGNHVDREFEGDIVRVICHELDHLDGILYTDKMVEEIFEDDASGGNDRGGEEDGSQCSVAEAHYPEGLEV